MKRAIPILKIACTVAAFTALLFACRKDGEPIVEPPNPNLPGTPRPKDSLIATADTIANHLRFSNAVKKGGTAPKGPTGSSLKISFKDTLYLMDELKGPIKFLHLDSTQDVAGVFVQVRYEAGTATFFHDVPELEDMADNDSVSVILIGIDPEGLVDETGVPPAGGPLGFEIVLVPHDKNGQPLAEIERTVTVTAAKPDPSGSSGCGLVLPPGDFWNWDLSLVEKPDGSGRLSFYNDPKKVWGGSGQFITGCCINGVSSYNQVLNCESDPTKARRKLFPTFFQYQESLVKFFAGGTYAHFSKQTHGNPEPGKSDFCSVAQGVVSVSARAVTADGNWTVLKRPPYKGDSLYLQLRQTASNGISHSQPDGYIHQLNCKVLVLVRPDNEVPDQDFVSFYTRINTDEDGWYELL